MNVIPAPIIPLDEEQMILYFGLTWEDEPMQINVEKFNINLI